MAIDTPQPVHKPPRPRGVWVLTTYALLFAGLLPVVTGLALLFSGSIAGSTSSPFGFLAGILINAGVIYASIRAWQGDERSRKLLVALVTIHYVLIGFSNALQLLSGEATASDQLVLLPRVFRGVLFPAIYLWYFSRKETLEFYHQEGA